ncbi:MAG TPA: lipoate--protein ligase [Bacteroidales bacterium]|nr:lipoate--protein ligase [Bacteroidales bacterium]
MNFFVPASHDPCLNLAFEEILLTKSNEEFIILGINNTSVISGKHQCIHREIETMYIWENKIPVIRRITGGGTVFHDPGNLNYTFILDCETGKQINFALYTKPVIEFLNSVGIKATLQGSDITAGGFKISGNAEHVYHNRVLHHGTILFNASLDSLSKCLRKDASYYNTRAIPSKPSPVKNLSEITSAFSHIEQFRETMLNYIMRLYKNASQFEPNENFENDAKKLIKEKYGSWDWNYAYGPEYVIDKQLSNGLRLYLAVDQGIIKEIKVEGDIVLDRSINRLIGVRHMPEDLIRLLEVVDLYPLNAFDFF